jgi:serine/threonine protein kinase
LVGWTVLWRSRTGLWGLTRPAWELGDTRPPAEASREPVWHSVVMQPVPRIGPYQIVAELGRGGMGVVYEVRDPNLPGRRLALKQILKDLCGPDALRRFAREAEMLAKVQHPNVVRVYACTLDPVAYLVTELVEGQDLQSLCVKEQLDPERSAEIAAQLCDAIGALHGAGIIHRDLKPENAILRPDGTPVLLDFGLARELDGEGLTRTGEVLGTPAYMSPEQADAAKDIDERTDVYGLGAILFQLLAGRAPFQAESMVRLLYKVLQDEPDWSALRQRDVPKALVAVTQRALEKERDDRYPSAQALAAELRRFIAGEEVLARPRRSNKTLGIAVGGVVVAAALAGTYLGLRPSPRDTPTPSATPSASVEATPEVNPLEGVRTPREFRELREKLGVQAQLELIEPFLDGLETNLRSDAVERMRGDPLRELPVQPAIEQTVKENLERGALFLPDQSYLTWHGRSKKLVHVLANGKKSWEFDLPHVANACTLAPDDSVWVFESNRLGSRVVAAAGDWSQPPTSEPLDLPSEPGNNRIAKVVAFSPSEEILAMGLGGRGKGKRGVVLFDLKQTPWRSRYLPQPPKSNPMTEALAWTADSGRLYVGGEGAGPTKIMTFGYSLAEEEPRPIMEGPPGFGTTVTTYDLALVGEDLFQSQRDGYVRRIQGVTSNPPHDVTFVDSGDPKSEGKTHGSEVVAVLPTAKGDWVYTVAGHFASGETHLRRERNQIRVWSRDSSGKLSLHATVNYHSAARRAYLSPDDRRLIMICVDGKFRLYDAWLLRQ